MAWHGKWLEWRIEEDTQSFPYRSVVLTEPALMVAKDLSRTERIQREVEGYLELGMAEHALKTLARLGSPSELCVRSLYLRGEALRSLDRYAEALVPLERASRLDSDNLHLWLALGWCHKRTGRLDLAISDLERALEINGADALVHYNLACYWSLVGSKQRALGYLSQALVINPRYRELIDEEPDFDPLRSDPEFQAVTSIVV